MAWVRPRRLLFLCAGLDLAALGLCAVLIDTLNGSDLAGRPATLLLIGAVYLFFSWLLGSYTVLRWPWLKLRLVLVRLFLSSLATLIVLILYDWALGFNVLYILGDKMSQVSLLACLTVASLVLRLVIRQKWPQAANSRLNQIFTESFSIYHPNSSINRANSSADKSASVNLGIIPSYVLPEPWTAVAAHSVAEQQLQRLPPALLPDEWMAIHQLPWHNYFSVQRQLKRVIDVTFSFVLLVLTSPILVVAGLLIWLEDRGPVFYIQSRSGLMGQPFSLIKLRTMRVSGKQNFCWTQPQDCRITKIGNLLRKTRLDELPQLINVIRGEMSLVGPRPERPELESSLEASIPHYRKRHWMPPGLSGWAQVSAPYASTLQEIELKLSYDLFYLRNWNIGLDFLILAKTVKTVLKASGR